MTRRELVEVIRWFERYCSAVLSIGHEVSEVVELVDGVLAVLESDGEYTLYFDKSKWELEETSNFSDLWADKDGVYYNTTGLVEDLMAGSWQDIAATARLVLKQKVGSCQSPEWHQEPIHLEY